MQHISISKLSTFWNAFSTTYACIYKVTHFVWAVQIECIPHKCKLELAAGVVSPPHHHQRHHPDYRHHYTFRNCRENVDGFTYISLGLPCSDNHIMAISDEEHGMATSLIFRLFYIPLHILLYPRLSRSPLTLKCIACL